MKDVTFPFWLLQERKYHWTAAALGPAGFRIVSEAPSSRLRYVPKLIPSRESINTNGPALPGPQAQLPPPNSLPQLASPLGYPCPTTLQPVFIPHQEFHKEELALCCLSVQDTNHQTFRKWNQEGVRSYRGWQIVSYQFKKKLWILPVVTRVACSPGVFCILIAHKKKKKAEDQVSVIFRRLL